MIFNNTKTYELTLVRSYVARWGMVEAVRELLQNALDSDSPFVYEFRVGEDMDGPTVSLKLNSEFAKLTPRHLLLGSTSKADNKDAIGSFGEGFKIALLVLTRLGYEVEIQNGDRRWRPAFEYNKRYKDELLVVHEDAWPYASDPGLTFWVHGLTTDDVRQIQESCLRMQDDIGEVCTVPLGRILLEQPGKLYVGGLFVCTTDLHYGYDIRPEHMKLERDRQTVSSFDLRWATKEMWFATKRFGKVAELIEADTPDLQYAEHGAPDLVKEACYALFRANHPGKVIAKNNEQMQELVRRGMTVYVGGDAYYSTVHNSRSYQSENSAALAVTPPRGVLEEWLRRNRSEMRANAIIAFKRDLLSAAEKWKAN